MGTKHHHPYHLATALIITYLYTATLPGQASGEPSYNNHRQYRILSDPYSYSYTSGHPSYPTSYTTYSTYNTHPYADYQRYRYVTPVADTAPSYQRYRYVAPAADTYRYVPPVADSYRYVPPVAEATRYVNYNSPNSYSDDDKVYITDKYGRTTVSRSGKYLRYLDTMTNSYRQGMVPLGTTTCSGSTCGSNAQCSIISGRPVCSCFRGYTGDPLHHCTRAECLDTSECRGHQTCVQERCVNVCEGACGAGAECDARGHIPVCSCPVGYTGDPFKGCRRFDPEELCHPSPCGQNTICEVNSGVPTCKCQTGYHGSPLAGCRHECDADADCGSHQACLEFKCQNPCLTQCGTNAECEGVRDSRAICKCPRGYHGSPYTSCQPECTVNSDCPRNKAACFYNQCKDPCEGVCGLGANCELRDVTPICSCPRDMTGDPFVKCRPFEKRDLCEPNPCGVNAKCEPGYDKYNEERPVCTCLPGHIGDGVRGCQRGECTEDGHCADHQGCVDYKCQNPCIGQCGSNANCNARRHVAVCTCPGGYNGDALVNCYAVTGTAVGRRFYRQVMEQARDELMREINEQIAEEIAGESQKQEAVQIVEASPALVLVREAELEPKVTVEAVKVTEEAAKVTDEAVKVTDEVIKVKDDAKVTEEAVKVTKTAAEVESKVDSKVTDRKDTKDSVKPTKDSVKSTDDAVKPLEKVESNETSGVKVV